MSTTQTVVAAAAPPAEKRADPPQDGVAPTMTTSDYIACEEEYAAKSLASQPVVLVRGAGAHLWDVEGRRYLDFLSAFSVVNQGHCHPRLVSVMQQQCQTLTLAARAFHNEHYPLLCRQVCKLLGLDLAFTMNSGSEAVDLAIKAARKWGYTVKGIPADQALVLTVSGNYHGKSLGPLSASDNPIIRAGYGPFLPGVGPDVVPGCGPIRFDNLADIEACFAAAGDRIAAVMVECVQGYAGCLPTSPGYLPALQALCRKHKALLVADEVQSGFGRTGYLMAYQSEGLGVVRPDLVVLGKALTGGMYTMGMVVGTQDALGQLQRGEHSSTFSGNPLACAVAREAVDIIVQEQLPERSLALGAQMMQRLAAMRTPAGTKISVTGRGLFCSLRLDETDPAGTVTAPRLVALMRERGVLAHAVVNRVRLAPPLVMDEADLWEGVQIVEACLNDLAVT